MSLKLKQNPIILFIWFCCFFLLNVKSSAGDKPVTLVLQWVPQAQFAGYYVAQNLGIYDKHGIDLTIIPGGPNISVIDCIKSGKADFGTFFLLNATKRVAQGIPLVNIAQISRRSALILVAKKSSGIYRPEDMNEKKIGIYKEDFSDIPMAFISANQLNVTIVPIATGINIFLHGGTDVTNVMWYNEYHTILNCGYNADELSTFYMSDYGFNVPEDGIYCLRSIYDAHPEVCERFVEATMEGWLYAFQHPSEALDMIIKEMKAVHIPANLAHQQWMLARMQDIILPDGGYEFSTFLSEETYEMTGQILLKNASIGKLPAYDQFYIPVGKYAEK
ncbi:MAG: ABC transporter substrate-binding protein [Candidatus Marinimicrobia bacterium]|nr:ABC transporter substrate-binding protein [Candidatus Neomarinimicrobiota bacterium]